MESISHKFSSLEGCGCVVNGFGGGSAAAYGKEIKNFIAAIAPSCLSFRIAAVDISRVWLGTPMIGVSHHPTSRLNTEPQQQLKIIMALLGGCQ